MANIADLPVRATPRVTFSSLVDILSSPAHRLVPLLQAQKYPKQGPVFGYKRATEQIQSWITRGIAVNPNDPALRDHEASALFSALTIPGAPSSLLPTGTIAGSIPTSEPTWNVAGVDVSFFPDLLLHGTVGKAPATGAVKLYMRKDPVSSGPSLAALLYYHRSQIVGDPTANPSLCALTDVQAGIVYTATGNYQRLLNQVQQACQVIAAVWPTL